jgi:hypothetical protein
MVVGTPGSVASALTSSPIVNLGRKAASHACQRNGRFAVGEKLDSAHFDIFTFCWRFNLTEKDRNVEMKFAFFRATFGASHSETLAILLNEQEANFLNLSEWTMISHRKLLDFDSAIPRFESWRPSHTIVRRCSQSTGNVHKSLQFLKKFRRDGSPVFGNDPLQPQDLTVSMTVH